ncbi:serine/threonine-protein kinase [Dokdonella sp.]|uniref:serine/threonine-protein kinase n=1 Tax=Dokdonella sp. TaxID=2291710 RepID=UPI0025C0E636|nr:serine/threonine-protein kinase [Dokdonella sp.]MBX3692885.1 serine/threonine protein kinase [Dokdonella sp.]
MSYARLRALFDRVHGLGRDAREAVYADEAVEAELRIEVEAMLQASAQDGDMIPDLIGEVAREVVGATDVGGERIGPWRVLGLLGEGGMGTVLLAERADGAFERKVAIKLIRGRVTARARERFLRERQTLAGLEHPNIASFIDAGTNVDGEPYLVMAHVEGEPLPDWLERAKPRLEARLRLFAALCRAVAHAHQHMVVHRDIKPSNILVRADAEPVLLDFGIAKLLETEHDDAATASRLMTPAWASPEQLLGRPVSTATDVFGLGLVLYALLAGSVPERGDAIRAASVELPPPSQLAATAALPAMRADARRLRGDLDTIARCAVRTDPAARYPSALALAADVEAWLAGRPVAAVGGHTLYLLSRLVRRHRAATAAVAAALALTVVFAVNLVQQRDRALSAEARATREAEVANETSRYLVELFSELDPELHPGRPLSARELLDLGRERLDVLASSDGAPVRARLQRSLGWIYANAGQPGPAIELLEAARHDAAAAPTDAERIRADTALARAYNQLDRHDDSLAAAVRAFAHAQAMSPRDDRMLGHALMVRGVAEQSLGRFDDARASYAQARQHFESAGAQIEVASVVHNLAWLAEQHGRPAEALAAYDEALTIKRATLGPDHPKTLNSQHGRSKNLAALGRYDESIAVLEDLLERSIRVYGDTAEPVQAALNELGSSLQDAGRYAEAQRNYERSLDLARALENGDGAMAAVQYNNLASLLEERGDLDGAEQLYRKSIDLRNRFMPEGHPGRLVPAHNLARLLMSMPQRIGEAQSLAEDVHRQRSAALPAEHRQVLQSALLLVQIALERNARDEAQTRLAGVEAAIARNPGITPSVRATAQRLRAQLAQDPTDASQRIAARRHALEIAAGQVPPGHPRHAQEQLALAETLYAAGQVEEARRLVASAAPVLRAALVPQARSLQQLAVLEQAVAK